MKFLFLVIGLACVLGEKEKSLSAKTEHVEDTPSDMLNTMADTENMKIEKQNDIDDGTKEEVKEGEQTGLTDEINDEKKEEEEEEDGEELNDLIEETNDEIKKEEEEEEDIVHHIAREIYDMVMAKMDPSIEDNEMDAQKDASKAPVSYCAVTLRNGVRVITKDLSLAQRVLGLGSYHHQQAIIPMTGGKAGDPHTLRKSWNTHFKRGSMYWTSWNEINKMRTKCQLAVSVASATVSYCAVSLRHGVRLRTKDLKHAQHVLGRGSYYQRQAIIPMTGNKAGDPHTLAKSWGSGSMYWNDWHDINKMRAKCEEAEPVPPVNKYAGRTHNSWWHFGDASKV